MAQTTNTMNEMTNIAETAMMYLQNGIKEKDTDKIIYAYELLEEDSFDWSDVDYDTYEDWDKLVDKGNTIIEQQILKP